MVVVGLLTVEVLLGEATSLKDKRHIIRSTLDTIRHKFKITAAETDFLDKLRHSEMAFAAVSNDRKFVNTVLDKVLQTVESDPRLEVVNSSLELL